jgi:T4-like virus Myoviridae tail sheath stabiliser
MLGNAQFYHRTIRKMVVVFGTLFNDLEIVRYTQAGVPKEKWKVPLTYSPKERFLTAITSDPNLIKSINTVVPRMSFNLDSLEYDVNRKQVSTLRNFAQNDDTSVSTQFVPIPYNYQFSLSIYVRNTEDGTQILEQILPFFTPDFNVTVDFIPEMDQKYNVPIILDSVASTVEYEGGMNEGTTRLILWDLTFTAKGYIWPPVKSGKYIKTANTNTFIDLTTRNLQKVYVDYANGNGVFAQGETLRANNSDLFGTVDYFSNTSSGVLVVTGANKIIQVGDKLTGDYTGASYNVVVTDINSLNVVQIKTTTDPGTASLGDEFGFIETIKEYPNTL